MSWAARWMVVAALAAMVGSESTAGPPFFTDDPVPVERGHREAYLFATWAAASGTTQYAAPAVEFNLGATSNLQLHLVAPYATDSAIGGPTFHGLGDVEFGIKYRFVQETDRRPQIGIFPMVELPTGNAEHGLGNGQVWARLPLWIQKSWGPWTTYGGGGYELNQAEGARSCFFAGWLLQRDLGKRLTLGGEVYATGADTVGGTGSTIFNAGGYYNFRPDFSLLFSLGHTFAGERHALAYLGLYWTWGPS
jgi:Putative MetA-pathway of phenol degradation